MKKILFVCTGIRAGANGGRIRRYYGIGKFEVRSAAFFRLEIHMKIESIAGAGIDISEQTPVCEDAMECQITSYIMRLGADRKPRILALTALHWRLKTGSTLNSERTSTEFGRVRENRRRVRELLDKISKGEI